MRRSQMPWAPQSQTPSVNVLYPPALLSPGHYPNGATYSFTADFRPPSQSLQTQQQPQQHQPYQLNSVLDPSKSSSPPRSYYQENSLTFSPPRSPPALTSIQTKARNSTKSALGIHFEEEDSNDCIQSEMKPNLCRLCGKTYARPSTLKTHLRTHSGERPYRFVALGLSFLPEFAHSVSPFPSGVQIAIKASRKPRT